MIVLTNDDGIEAPGISALQGALGKRIESVTVAPLSPCSGCGHAVTTHQPLRVLERDEGLIAVDGTPADCVRVALFRWPDKIAWVLSGINAGGNLGCDVFHSGTVAAVREAALRGVKGIAFSQYIIKGRPIDWDRAARSAARVFDAVRDRPLPPLAYWNANFPCLDPDDPEPPIVQCLVDPSPLPMEYRTAGELWTYTGSYPNRARIEGCDVAVCFGGSISLSLVPFYA
jgi:5'-nucleotidase